MTQQQTTLAESYRPDYVSRASARHHFKMGLLVSGLGMVVWAGSHVLFGDASNEQTRNIQTVTEYTGQITTALGMLYSGITALVRKF